MIQCEQDCRPYLNQALVFKHSKTLQCYHIQTRPHQRHHGFNQTENESMEDFCFPPI